jgi:UDP-glucose 4-epimerase
MSQRGQKVFVTGGAGFIGSNLVRLLTEESYTVTAFDNFSVGQRSYLEGLPVVIAEGDISDAKAIANAMEGHDHVVHLAAQTGVPLSLENPRRDCELNVLGTLNGLEAARSNGIQTFVFASSNATVGRQPPPAVETAAPLPVSPYGASKLAGEGYCLAYHGSFGLRAVVLRFGNVYGPYCSHKQSVIPRFMRDMQAGTLQIDGDGGQTRDFIYVQDLCRAIIAAIRSEVGGEVFQISTGTETSIRELADLVMETTHSQLRVEHSAPREGDVRRNYSQIGKAKELLGWEPKVNLKDGLATTWNWMTESGATAGA